VQEERSGFCTERLTQSYSRKWTKEAARGRKDRKGRKWDQSRKIKENDRIGLGKLRPRSNGKGGVQFFRTMSEAFGNLRKALKTLHISTERLWNPHLTETRRSTSRENRKAPSYEKPNLYWNLKSRSGTHVLQEFLRSPLQTSPNPMFWSVTYVPFAVPEPVNGQSSKGGMVQCSAFDHLLVCSGSLRRSGNSHSDLSAIEKRVILSIFGPGSRNVQLRRHMRRTWRIYASQIWRTNAAMHGHSMTPLLVCLSEKRGAVAFSTSGTDFPGHCMLLA
jgi:hypothetical protein